MSNKYTKVLLLLLFSIFSLYSQQKISKPNVLTETEPNNTAPQANTVSIGDSLVANISISTDVDYYKITVAAGDTLDILCSDINGSTLNGNLSLFDETGNTLRNNDNYINNQHSRIVYGFAASGTYYLRYMFYANISSFPNKPTDSKEDKADSKKLKASTQNIDNGDYSISIKRFTPEKAVCEEFSMNNVLESSMQLIARFYPFSANTNVFFEYGTTAGYGSSVPANANPYSGLSRTVAYSDHISGFIPGTLYHIRARFENPQGISYSDGWTIPTPEHSNNWVVQKNNDSSYIFRAASFPDKYTGYVVGNFGRIYKTTDAGQTWNSQYFSQANDLFSVSFCDVNNGFAVGGSPVILKTTDGGENWLNVTIPIAAYFTSVVMFDVNNLLVSTNTGSVMISTDGGTSWAVYNACPGYTILNMSFVNNNIGYACGTDGQIIKTTNGGMDWAHLNSGVTTALYGISFVDENVGYAVGNSNVILKTTNGGTEWVAQTAGAVGDFLSVAFSDSSTGFIVGTSGRMLKTSDGGTNWVYENSGTYNDLLGIRKAGVKDFYVVGENDLVLKFKNEIWITFPAGGESFFANDLINITWNATEQIRNVKIDYTTDSGMSWNEIVATTPASTGTFTWIAPLITSSTVKIRISDADDPSIFNINAGNITIRHIGFMITSPTIGDQWSPGTAQNITWNSFGVADFKIDYSLDDGASWFPITASTPAASGSFLWTIPIFISPSSTARIKISDAAYPAFSAMSYLFTIRNQNPIAELEPNNTFPQAHVLTYGDSVLASVNPEGDIDYYSFYAMAGDVIDVYAAVRNGSQLDGKITLYDSLGGYLSVNDDYNGVLDSRLEFNITQTGRYYLRYAYYDNNIAMSAKLAKAERQTKKISSPSSSTSGDYYLLFKRFNPGTAVGRLTYHDNIMWNSIRVGGVVYPNGLVTTVTIQYSTDLSYSNSVQIEGGPLAGIDFYEFRSEQITGLLPNTQYNFRIMMSNSAGVTYSAVYQPTTPEAPVGWSIIDAGTTNRFTTTAMLNQNTAFAAGFNGVIRKTTDGGISWAPQVSGMASHILSMSFVDPLNGYINSSIGELYKTTNGGESWSAGSIVSGTIEDYMSISFATVNLGATVTYQGHIYITTDGGLNWMMIAHPNTNHLRFVKFINASTAFAVGDNGVIIKTSDGGLIWESRVSNTTRNLYSISFSDPLNGLAVGTQGTVLKTTDGGETWSNAPYPRFYNLLSVSCFGSNQAIVSGDWGELSKTTDGGQNWILQKSGTNNAITTTSMFNSSSGIIAGNFGYLAKLSSSLSITSPIGGENWVMGTSHNITWNSNGVNNIKIEYSINNGSTWLTQAASVPATSGAYSWVIPNLISTQVKIKLSDADNPSLFSVSNSFSITGHGAFTEVEPNNIASQANIIAYGDSVYATINITSDVDYYSFTASAGDTVEIISNQRNSSGLNGLLILYSADGTVINSSFYFTDNNTARIIYVFSVSGTFYIRFSSTSNAGYFPNKPNKETDQLPNKDASVNTNIGDYSLVLRKFVPAKPAVGSINMRNLFSNAFRVEGSIYTMGLSTTVSVEYGTTSSYGTTAQAAANPYAANLQPVNAMSSIIGVLEPNTLYHYRIKAENSMGTGYSPDMTFTTPQSAQGWMPFTIYQQDLQQFLAVKVFDQNNVVVVGNTAFKTTNAGLAWSTSTGISGNITDLSFVDANNGYAVGETGLVFKTSNGGAAWVQAGASLSASLSSVSFIDNNNGFAVGLMNHTLYKTTNGGTNWTQVVLTNIDRISRINMLSLTTGYICGNNGTFAKTTDGGTSWTYQTLQNQPYLNDIFCKDVNTIFVIGNGGKIFKSTNGGTSWLNITIDVTNNLNKITFEDADNGLIVGSGGVILRTINGGSTWFQQFSGTTNDFYGASMANDLAIVTGPYGVLAVSANALSLDSPAGGENWQVGSTHNITWYHRGVSRIKIEYSLNNGSSWTQIAASAPTNTGSYPWTLPLTASTQAKVRLTSIYDTSITSVNTNAFTISARGTVSETEPNNTATSANAIILGDSLVAAINPVSDVDYFSFNAQAGDTIDVLYSSVNGSNFDGTVKLYDSNGLYLWSGNSFNNFGYGVIKSKLAYIFTTAGTYYLRVAQTGNTGVFPNKKARTDEGEIHLADAENQQNGPLSAGEYSLRFRKFTPEAPGFVYGSLNPVYSLNYNKAILQCFVITNNLPTTVTFEYGTSTSYGSQVSSSGSIVPVLQYSFCTSNPLTGLTGNTTYHFRFKAENALGVTYTPDRTFTTPETPTNWIFLNDNIAGSNLAVQVIDANLMFVVKNTGIVKSTDGGNTWLNLPVSSGFFSGYGICFIDANVGYVVGANGYISKTTNSGTSWVTQTSSITQKLNSVSFSDANNGFAVGVEGVILKTINGGATWSQINAGTTLYLSKVKMINNNTILICGNNGLFLKSTNGGLNWISQTIIPSYDLRDIVGFDASNYMLSGGGLIAKTTNGGVDWTNISPGLNDYGSLSFSNNEDGIVLAGEGKIFRTNNGGKSWYQQHSGTINMLNSVSFVNNVALVGGNLFELLKSGNYIHIKTPAGGETFNAGAVYPVTWAQAGITNVKVELSTDDGATWQVVTPSTAGSANLYNWTIPAITVLNHCKLKISDAANLSMYSVSEGTFSIYSYPSAPVPVSPASNSTGQPTTVTLVWHKALNAQKYVVDVARDAAFNTIVVRDTVTSDTTKLVTGLLNNTQYFWKIVSINSAGSSPNSAVWNFTTIAAAPLPPVIIAPANNAVGIPSSTLFLWYASATAASYHLQISTDSLFATFFYRDSTLTDTLKAIPGLANSTVYYWRICAKGAGGTGNWSPVARFTTSAPSSTIVGSLTYANGARTPLTDVKIILSNSINKIDSTVTGAGGAFTFYNVPNGVYTLSESTSKEWNGVNSTDALLIRRYLSGLGILDSLQIKCADVNGNGSLNSTDALIIRRRLAGAISNFTVPDWVFENPTLSLSGSAVNLSLRALCTGDVNGSYTPAAAKLNPLIELTKENSLQATINKEFDVPVFAAHPVVIGAVTLVLSFPKELVSLISIKSKLSGFEYGNFDGKVVIAWDDVNAYNANDNEPLFVLKFKGTQKFADGIRFSLNAEQGSELADAEGNPLKGALLKTPTVEAFVPKEINLEQNYPNPFNPSTQINYQVPKQGFVTLKVYDVIGNLVSVLVDEEKEAGSYSIQFNFNSSKIASGVYFYELKFMNTIRVRKMMILK